MEKAASRMKGALPGKKNNLLEKKRNDFVIKVKN